MAGSGNTSDKVDGASSSKLPSAAFMSSHRSIPPPLASSTPKKSKPNGLLNGVDHSGSKSLKTVPTILTIGSSTNEGASQKKRRVAYMDESEDEDHGVSLTTLNGHANGHANGKSNSKLNQVRDLKRAAELQEQRKQLPIAKGREALIREIKEHDTVVLLGETGSGKTTQVPQYVLESGIAGTGQIAVTQPRRVAATSLAARVAQEQGVAIGTRVGYAVRFNERHDASTRIMFVTDGMLARERLADPLLSRYSVIMIDEAHERTLNTDLLMASLKVIQKERAMRAANVGKANGKGKEKEEIGPLKLIIMSATLDAEKFSKFFNNAKILYVQGRQHPVKIYHTAASQNDYVDSALRTFFQIHVDQPPGDVLIFLPGQEDIESLEKQITSLASQLPVDQLNVITCPLYASLPQSRQTKAFHPTPPKTRKCILATNIAETSITIPGIKYVIDTGKCKEKHYLAGYQGGGMDTLLTRDISKSSAMQRTGRAGREGPGFCFRLYTESDFDKLAEASAPEIMRCSLTSSMLQLKCLGLELEALDFMDKPDVDAIYTAYKTLFLLGAIDSDKVLNGVGRQMNHFPLDPPYSRALLSSVENGCTLEVLGIVSVLSASSKLFFDSSDGDQREAAYEARAKFRHPSGDHMTAYAAFTAYQELVEAKESKSERKEWCRKQFVNERTLSEAIDIHKQLRGICDKMKIDWRVSCGGDVDRVLKSLLDGLAQHVALSQSDGYRQIVGNVTVKIHPGSVLSDRKHYCIMYDEIVFTGSAYARGVSSVPASLLAKVSAFKVTNA